MQWTTEQSRAINERNDNILLSAAAGSGKTTVLVERVLQLVLTGVSIDRMLIVTFTRAASSDMRLKLTQKLQEKIEQGHDDLRPQLLALEHASISTLHSFCSEFLRTHFEISNIDPSFSLLDATQTNRLIGESLDKAIEDAYENPSDDLLRLDYGRGPKKVRAMAETLFLAVQEHPEPREWLEKVCNPDDSQFYAWMEEFLSDYRRKVNQACDSLKQLMQHPDCTENVKTALESDYTQISAILGIEDPYDFLDAVRNIKFARIATKKGFTTPETVTELRNEIKKTVKDEKITEFNPRQARLDTDAFIPALHALRDITWSAIKYMDERKRDMAVLTFSDLEHYTLLTLKDEETARSMREKYEYVFVDEYQDTSDVQEAIIRRIMRGNNVFMVGDVKQSIYRFRQAEPRLFMEKYDAYQRHEGGILLPLTMNFRSRPVILDFVNHIFERAMQGGASEILYDDLARLNHGNEKLTGGSAELHIFQNPDIDEEENADIVDMASCEREALFIAASILRMKKENPGLRFRDFAVLTRTKQGVLGRMSAILNDNGVPSYADGNDDFYDTMEIALTLSYLKLIVNRRNDIELTGALRSCCTGLTADELAVVRLVFPQIPFIDAAVSYASLYDDSIARRLSAFLKMLDHWQLMSLCSGLGVLVRLVLNESGLYDYAGSLPGGAQRQANLDRLVLTATNYDRSTSGSLTRFLNHLENLRQRGESDDAHILGENDDVVRLMTIHKSKGLEFPIVFGAMMGRKIGSRPMPSELRTHRTLGLGCTFYDEELKSKRDMVSALAIKSRDDREERAEELRILYVLLTRAQDRLILTGSCKSIESIRQFQTVKFGHPESAKTYMEIILSTLSPEDESRYPVYEHMDYTFEELAPGERQTETMDTDPEIIRELLWKYPHVPEGHPPIKLTVTGLIREIQNPDELEPLVERPSFLSEDTGRMTGSERGTAYHRSMQYIDLDVIRGLDPQGMFREINKELDSFALRNLMTENQRASVNTGCIVEFFVSSIGQRMLASPEIHREWSFTTNMRIADALTPEEAGSYLDEVILVQGSLDCCFMENGQWVLIDFKTDRSAEEEVFTERYRSQLRMYAAALTSITGIPVAETHLFLLLSREDLLIR